MATVTGPLHSLQAVGTYADTITFRRGRRNAIVTKKPTHPGQASDKQKTHRETFASLAALWRQASTEERDSWTSLAYPEGISNYAAFIRANFARIAAGEQPIAELNQQTTPTTALHINAGETAPDPDVTGDYVQVDDINEYPAYRRVTEPRYWLYFSSREMNYAIATDADNEFASELFYHQGAVFTESWYQMSGTGEIVLSMP